jgi:CRISPR-associated protein Cas2
MIYLLFYDITNDKIRTKIAKQLIAEGYERLQYSVYTFTQNPKNNRILWSSLKRSLAEEPNAKLYVLGITKKNFKNIQVIGDLNFNIVYLIGNKRSLTF